MPWVEDDSPEVAQQPATGGRWVEDDTPQRSLPETIDRAYNSYMKGSGMVERALVQGVPAAIMGLPALAADAYDSLSNVAIRGYNAVAPKMGLPESGPVPVFRNSQAVNDLGVSAADAMNLPKPETKMGRGLLNIGSAGFSALGGAGAAGTATRLLGGPGSRVGGLLSSLAEAPALQAAGAAGSTLATEVANGAGVKNPYALMAIGMLGGGTSGVGATVGGRTARGVGQLVAPFRSVGENGFMPGVSREVIAGKTLNRLATTPGLTPDVLAGSQPIIPGSNPTIAQVSRDPGLISAEPGIRNALDNGQATSGRFALRNSQQNQARTAELDRITMPSEPVPEGAAPRRGTLEYAEAKRDRAVDENMAQAFQNRRQTDITPVVDTIAGIRASRTVGPRKSVQDAMDFAEGRLTQEGFDLSDPETLYSIRKDIALARDGKYNSQDKSDLRLARGELQTVIDSLDNAIESGAPGYRRYMDLYAARSRPLNQQEAIGNLRERGRVSATDPVTGENTPILTVGKFGNAFRRALTTGALGPGVGNGNLSNSQISALANIAADIDRGAASTAATVKPVGSDTFKNLSIANVIGTIMGDAFPSTPAGQGAQTIAKPLSWLYTIPDQQVGQLLVEASLDPQLAARLMRQATRYEVQAISEELATRAAQQMKGGALYGANAP